MYMYVLCVIYIVSFQIYDIDGDNKISRDELKGMLTATMNEKGIVLTNSEIDVIVNDTFRDIHPANANMIVYDE